MFGIVCCNEPRVKQHTQDSYLVVTDDFKYFVYAWYFPKGNWEFYLDHYVNIDKNGKFKAMIRDSTNKSLYYTGTIDNSLTELINKAFRVDKFKSDYKSDRLQNMAYSGFTYCIEYTMANSLEGKKLHFIQNRSPALINILSTELDSIIYKSKAHCVDTLDIASPIEEFRKYSAASLGEPPKSERPKFNPNLKLNIVRILK